MGSTGESNTMNNSTELTGPQGSLQSQQEPVTAAAAIAVMSLNEVVSCRSTGSPQAGPGVREPWGSRQSTRTATVFLPGLGKPPKMPLDCGLRLALRWGRG